MDTFTRDLRRPGTVALALWRGAEAMGALIALRMSPAELSGDLSLEPRLDAAPRAAAGHLAEVVLLDLTFVHPDAQRQGWMGRLHAERSAPRRGAAPARPHRAHAAHRHLPQVPAPRMAAHRRR